MLIMLDSIRKTLTELSARMPAKVRAEKQRNFYDMYTSVGDEARRFIAEIQKITDELSHKYGASLKMKEEVFKKVKSIEEFINVSEYSPADFATNVSDDSSVWVTGRIKKAHEASDLVKQYSSAAAKVQEKGKQQHQVMKWPDELAKDIDKLCAWTNAVETAIGEIKNIAEDDNKDEIDSAEQDLSEFRNLLSKWTDESVHTASVAKNTPVTEEDTCSFIQMLADIDTQRTNIRKTVKSKEKAFNRLAAIRKKYESIEGLKRDATMLKQWRDKVETMVLSKRMYAHSKWRCRQALAEASFDFTGDPVKDYHSMTSAIFTLKTAANNASYY